MYFWTNLTILPTFQKAFPKREKQWVKYQEPFLELNGAKTDKTCVVHLTWGPTPAKFKIHTKF